MCFRHIHFLLYIRQALPEIIGEFLLPWILIYVFQLFKLQIKVCHLCLIELVLFERVIEFQIFIIVSMDIRTVDEI